LNYKVIYFIYCSFPTCKWN